MVAPFCLKTKVGSILISGHLLYSIGSGEISSLRSQRSNEQDLHELKAVSLPSVLDELFKSNNICNDLIAATVHRMPRE